MTDVKGLQLPALSSQPNVEIAQTGQWDISTGRVTLTEEDFSFAIAALDCPAVRKPVIKLGHIDPRFDGEPSIGFVDNLSLADKGHTIVGDYVGMPGWLGPILSSAYPDRSMEATWDFMCQLGHVHPFVITAVALLGVTPPGIGTLESLQDVASLYGVEMAARKSESDRGFSVTIRASGKTMPNPKPHTIAAGVTTEDIRRSFYEFAPVSVWIKEMELSPLQLITVDEATDSYARIPVELDGDEFTFGEPVPVEVQYVDKPVTANASASRLVYASKAESRPTVPEWNPSGTIDPAPAPKVQVEKNLDPKDAIKRVVQASNQKKGSGEMDPKKIREALGLPADATDDDVFSKLAAARSPEPSPEPTPEPAPAPIAAGAGVVVLDQSVVNEMKRQAEQGAAAFEQMRKNERDSVIASAIKDGKFAPSRKTAWEKLWDADPEGTRAQIENLSPGLVPMQASGYPGNETYEQNETYFGLYPEERPEGIR